MPVAPQSGNDADPPHAPLPPIGPAAATGRAPDPVSALADALAADDGATGAVNRPATVGFLLGIASVVLNPVLLIGLAAMVLSAVGLYRASLMGQHGYSAVGRGKALGGIALGLLGTAASVAFKNSLF